MASGQSHLVLSSGYLLRFDEAEFVVLDEGLQKAPHSQYGDQWSRIRDLAWKVEVVAVVEFPSLFPSPGVFAPW
jgi:hypothetical protein